MWLRRASLSLQLAGEAGRGRGGMAAGKGGAGGRALGSLDGLLCMSLGRADIVGRGGRCPLEDEGKFLPQRQPFHRHDNCRGGGFRSC